jgi:hypothetical protein
MKAWILAMVGSVAWLSGCAAQRPAKTVVPAAQLVTAEKAYVDTSLSRLRNSLKDPESARFYGVYAAQKPGQPRPSICGAVNAKNSYGGFTGKTLFLATPDVAVLSGGLNVGAGSVGSEVIVSNCTLAPGQPAPPSLDVEYR